MTAILFITTGVGTGGAEVVLQRLTGALSAAGHACAVLSITGDGKVGRSMAQSGVMVRSVDLRSPSGWTALRSTVRGLLRDFRPAVIQGWMYHGNLIAQLVSSTLRGGRPLVLAVRQCVYDLRREKRMTRAAIRMDARLSRRAYATTYVSDAARQQHVELGYVSQRAVVIANGLDVTERPRRDEACRSVRTSLGIGADEHVIGHVARYHPVKGHRDFLMAAAPIHRQIPSLRIVLAGAGVDRRNEELLALIQDLDLGDRVTLLGESSDVPRLMCGFDVFCSSSLSEGFPNVVCEAMAAEIPCVVTDVGESAHIVGDTGIAVAAGDVERMREALQELLSRSTAARRELGVAARERVATRYSLASMASAYESLYRNAIGSARPAGE